MGVVLKTQTNSKAEVQIIWKKIDSVILFYWLDLAGSILVNYIWYLKKSLMLPYLQ